MQGKTANIVCQNLENVISDLGFNLYDVEYAKKQNGMNLTIFITKDNDKVTIQDCELVHRTIDPLLDELDPTNGQSYYLNVSSVGLDRPLKLDKDFERCLGQEVIAKVYEAIDKQKEFLGVIKSYTQSDVVLTLLDGKEVVIARQNLANCKINIKF
ncbi:MAG: ribosome maturation factor RimP [Clostridia bacterium]|nr:ribosome maturation factor RimP [Clostridia bacterium]